MKKIIYTGLAILVMAGCKNNNQEIDAFGNFESDEVLVSSEVNGKLVTFDVEEGRMMNKGQHVGLVDTTHLHLQKLQLEASMEALRASTQNVESEIAVLEMKEKNIAREVGRIEKLVKDEAATQQQLDDLKGQLELTQRQIRATEIKLNNANRAVLSQMKPIRYQILQIEDQINKSGLINPISGTVLTKYIEENEIVNFGRALYKIADMERVYLRAYISEDQLASIRTGQKVIVAIDDGNEMKEYEGTVTWVSDVAEFTPKIIQTKTERKNLVYAVKVAVTNDGSIKLGMPGEMKIENE